MLMLNGSLYDFIYEKDVDVFIYENYKNDRDMEDAMIMTGERNGGLITKEVFLECLSRLKQN